MTIKKRENRLPWLLPTDETARSEPSEDAFGHERYSKALEELLTSAEQGYTIGLFGGYGTGKSWVVRDLRRRLEAGSSGVAVVEYDAWRYADDEIRRDFLLELRRQLLEQGLFSGEAPDLDADAFKVDIDTTTEAPEEFSWAAFRTALGHSALILAGATVTGALAGGAFGVLVFGFDGAAVVTSVTSAVLGAAGWASQVASRLVRPERLSIRTIQQTHRPRIEFPEEFTSSFQRLITATSSEYLLIVIDNLDRCAPDVALRVLTTVKNFLEPADPRVFFLLPCDMATLERHLAATFVSRGLSQGIALNDSKEFLRKLFAFSITITQFDPLELRRLAERDLLKIRFGGSLDPETVSGVAQMVASANRNSPREVRSFINLVSATALLLDQSELSGSGPPTALDITKLVAIREKAPDLWQAIMADPRALEVAERNIHESPPATENEQIDKALQDPNQRRTIMACAWHSIAVPTISTLLTVRTPVEAQAHPRYFEFIGALEDANLDLARAVAQDSSGDQLPALLEWATTAVGGTAFRDSGTVVNASVVGVHLLGEFDFPWRQRVEFLRALSDGILTSTAELIGPSALSAAIARTAGVPGAGLIKAKLIDRLDTAFERALDGLASVEPELSSSEKGLVQAKIAAKVAEDISLEQHLRGLSGDVRRSFIAEDTLSVLIAAYQFPEDGDGPPVDAPSGDALREFAPLLSEALIRDIVQRAEAYLTRRQEQGIAFGDIDSNVLQFVTGLAERADRAPLDSFGPVIEQLLAPNDPATNERLALLIPILGHRLAGQAAGALKELIVRLAAREAGIEASRSTELALGANVSLSPTVAASIQDRLESLLASAENPGILEFSITTARSAGAWGTLAKASRTRAESGPDPFRWIREGATSLLGETEEIKAVFADSIEGLMKFLGEEPTEETATRELVAIAPAWKVKDAERILDLALPMLLSSDVARIQRGVRLASEATSKSSRLFPKVKRTVVDALVSGPLGLDGPQELFDLQLGSIESISYPEELKVRELVKSSIRESVARLDRAITLAQALLVASPDKHSDELIKPLVDLALIAGDASVKDSTLQAISSLRASKDELDRNQEGLGALEITLEARA